MLYLIVIVVIAFIWYFVSRKGKAQERRSVPTRSATSNASTRHLENELDWLHERWKLADNHRQSGKDSIFPHWYFDESTDRQKLKLTELGIKTGPDVTKGQASDLIGLHEAAGEHDLDVLKFFKRPVKGMNQTRARHDVAKIFEDSENVRVWEERPPSQEQKEFFIFFGIKPGKGITASQASKLISEYEAELSSREDTRLDEWEALEEVIEELSDAALRSDYDIKKPSTGLIKSALENLKKQGKSFRESADDIELIVEKLIELKPDIKRD